MTYAIEKHVPMPIARNSRSRLPFLEMEVGDSFMVADHPETYVRAMCSREQQRHGIKLSTRTQLGGGLRVWRIA